MHLLRNKTALIFGLGKFGGGLDCAKFAAKYCKKVLVTDISSEEKLAAACQALKELPNVELRLGKHDETDFAGADVVIVNPAVPPENQYLQIARLSGALITSQMELFFQICPAVIIGITGANGKSTTTKLTYHILDYAVKKGKSPCRQVFLGGNIGNMPLLTELENISSSDIVVLEISSFQAEQLAQSKLAPDVSIAINVTPNHLDRHGTFEAYCLAKENLFIHQRRRKLPIPVSIFNLEDEVTRSWYDKYLPDKSRKCIKFAASDVCEDIKAAFPLPGKANLSNLAAARAAAKIFGVDDSDIAQAVKSFQGLPHRLELAAQGGGVRWYNDSIATTPPSTIVGLEAFDEPIILIAGGYDKMLPFDQMGVVAAKKAKAVILIGTTAEKIEQAIIKGGGCTIYKEKTFADAINRADSISECGDVVLLSPACASYDMFDNFQQRGDIFRKAAIEICSKKA